MVDQGIERLSLARLGAPKQFGLNRLPPIHE
jgi:hypothetical protein